MAFARGAVLLTIVACSIASAQKRTLRLDAKNGDSISDAISITRTKYNDPMHYNIECKVSADSRIWFYNIICWPQNYINIELKLLPIGLPIAFEINQGYNATAVFYVDEQGEAGIEFLGCLQPALDSCYIGTDVEHTELKVCYCSDFDQCDKDTNHYPAYEPDNPACQNPLGTLPPTTESTSPASVTASLLSTISAFRNASTTSTATVTSSLLLTTFAFPNTSTTSSTEDTMTTTGYESSPGYNPILKSLADDPIGPDNVTAVVNKTRGIAGDYSGLTPEDFYLISIILEKAVAIANLSETTSSLVLETIDACLNADASIIRDAPSHSDTITPSQRMLNALPTLVVHSAADGMEFLDGRNLGLVSERVNVAATKNFPMHGQRLDLRTDSQSTIGITDVGGKFIRSSESADHGARSIQIPDETITSSKATHAFVTISRNMKLFTSNSSNYATISLHPKGRRIAAATDPSPCERQLILPDDGAVLSASLLSQGSTERISRLSTSTNMARIRLNDVGVRPLHGDFAVSWWTGEGWSGNEWCAVSKDSDGTIIADCNHLTDFTLIIDGVVNDPILCSTGLIVLGEVLSTISIISLLIVVTLTVLRIAPDLPQSHVLRAMIPRLAGPFSSGNPDLDGALVSLSHLSALFAFHVFFALFSGEVVAGPLCSTFAALNYALLLINILFTIFSSMRIVLVFFRTAGQNSSNWPARIVVAVIRFIVLITRVEIVMAATFGLPSVLSIFLLALTPVFNRNDGMCWVRPDYVAASVVLPITLTIINGTVCLVLVAYRILPIPGRNASINQSTQSDIFNRVVSLFLMQFTLGIPWVVEYTFGKYFREISIFHVLFTIVIGSQGLVMLLLFLYKVFLSERIRRRSMVGDRNNDLQQNQKEQS